MHSPLLYCGFELCTVLLGESKVGCLDLLLRVLEDIRSTEVVLLRKFERLLDCHPLVAVQSLDLVFEGDFDPFLLLDVAVPNCVPVSTLYITTFFYDTLARV